MVRMFSRLLACVVLFAVTSLSIAQEADFPKINFYYLIPSDRAFNQSYVDGIERAALSVQSFYSKELGGAVFTTTNPIVQVVYSDNDAAWHADQMWDRARETVGTKFNDPNNVYVIYVDAMPSCTPNNGIGGTSGVAVVPENDLRGLAGLQILPDTCSGRVDIEREGRWFGGLAHELGHALGLPHPVDCNLEGESGPACDTNSVMWLGYIDYPNTYFGSEDIATLLQSVFFSSSYANPRSFPIQENFESTLAWYDTGEFDWTVHSGSTPSGDTGPGQAAQGASYLYFETSIGSAYYAGSEAVLESDVFAAQDAKISFQYHMFGADTGSLSIDVSSNGLNWETLWSVSGQQHNADSAAWTSQVVRLDAYSGNIRMRIRATAAGGYRGDVAIDSLKVHNGVEILASSFDGDWYYTEWTPVSYASNYVQFVIGDSGVDQRWLYRYGSGASNRGDFLYEYYHKNDICAALGAGTYELSAQVWPEFTSELGSTSERVGTITCN